MANQTNVTQTPRQQRFASVMIDVLVYTIVLNLFVEHAESVVIDSFTISIFTAILLKVMLDIILSFEHRVSEFFERFEGTVGRVMSYVAAVAILFISKFVILEVVDIVFGDEVELGSLFMVIAIVLSLMISRELVSRIYFALGDQETADSTRQGQGAA